jgi:hypothetical protein
VAQQLVGSLADYAIAAASPAAQRRGHWRMAEWHVRGCSQRVPIVPRIRNSGQGPGLRSSSVGELWRLAAVTPCQVQHSTRQQAVVCAACVVLFPVFQVSAVCHRECDMLMCLCLLQPVPVLLCCVVCCVVMLHCLQPDLDSRDTCLSEVAERLQEQVQESQQREVYLAVVSAAASGLAAGLA